MTATLLDLPVETPEPSTSCLNCPAVERLERALEQLQRDFCREVGYWKSQHAKAVQRIEQLQEELDQSRGQVRALQDKLFGRKTEKSAQGNRSNDLFDPENVAATAKKRGAQPGHAGHDRRDYSHLPVVEEFITLPEESLLCPICGKPAARLPTTFNHSCLGIFLPNAVRHCPSNPHLRRPPTPPDIGRHRPASISSPLVEVETAPRQKDRQQNLWVDIGPKSSLGGVFQAFTGQMNDVEFGVQMPRRAILRPSDIHLLCYA